MHDIIDFGDFMKTEQIGNPYSAEHPMHPAKFAGREKQLSEFEGFLNDTISGNSKNVAVLGEWGIGI